MFDAIARIYVEGYRTDYELDHENECTHIVHRTKAKWRTRGCNRGLGKLHTCNTTTMFFSLSFHLTTTLKQYEQNAVNTTTNHA